MPVSTCCRESSAARWQGHAVAMHAHVNLINLVCMCFPTFITCFHARQWLKPTPSEVASRRSVWTKEAPSDAPTPLGRPVEINAWVDADHAGDRLTRRSHTGILIFVQSAPIFWYSKRQATIESSTFGSEIVGMRTCLEFVKDLRSISCA